MVAHLKAPQRIMAELATANFDDKITKYDLAKRLGLSYARVHEAIEGRRKANPPFTGLESLGLVKHMDLGTTNAGHTKKAYKSTLKGLVHALTNNPTLWKKIDSIARKNQELLPLVFGKWKHFSDYRCKTAMVKILRRVFGTTRDLMREPIRTRKAKIRDRLGDGLFRDAVYDNVFRPELYHVLNDSNMKKWISAIKNDLDLRQKYLDETVTIKDTAQDFLNIANTRLKNISDSPITKKEKEKAKGGEKA